MRAGATCTDRLCSSYEDPRRVRSLFLTSFVRHARHVSCVVDRRRAVDVVDEVLQSCRCPTSPVRGDGRRCVGVSGCGCGCGCDLSSVRSPGRGTTYDVGCRFLSQSWWIHAIGTWNRLSFSSLSTVAACLSLPVRSVATHRCACSFVHTLSSPLLSREGERERERPRVSFAGGVDVRPTSPPRERERERETVWTRDTDVAPLAPWLYARATPSNPSDANETVGDVHEEGEGRYPRWKERKETRWKKRKEKREMETERKTVG